MRVAPFGRHTASTIERLLGRRRARRLRRRLGLAALGAGVLLLRPRTSWKPVGVCTVFVLGVVLAVAIR